MEYLGLIGFVFGIFGLVAYMQISPLKTRIAGLERELTRMRGTTYHETRSSLMDAAQSCIGRSVTLELAEDHEDGDVFNYGNTKHGSITILDADEEWLYIQIESPKGTKRKLLRMESVERISAGAE